MGGETKERSAQEMKNAGNAREVRRVFKGLGKTGSVMLSTIMGVRAYARTGIRHAKQLDKELSDVSLTASAAKEMANASATEAKEASVAASKARGEAEEARKSAEESAKRSEAMAEDVRSTTTQSKEAAAKADAAAERANTANTAVEMILGALKLTTRTNGERKELTGADTIAHVLTKFQEIMTTVTPLSRRVDSLEQRLGEVSEQNSTLKTQLDDANEERESLRAANTSLINKLKAVELKEESEEDSRLRSARQSLDSLKGDVTENLTELALILRSQGISVDDFELNISGSSTAPQDMRTEMEQFEDQAATATSKIISALEARGIIVEDADLNEAEAKGTEGEKIQTEIQNLDNALGELFSKIVDACQKNNITIVEGESS